MNNIPKIDVTPLFEDDLSGKKNVAKQIDVDACRKSGFFEISGHHIENLDVLMQQTKRFFKDLTPEEKLEYAPNKWNPRNSNIYRGYFPSIVNGKEGLDMSNPNFTANNLLVQNRDLYNLCVPEECPLPDDTVLPGFKLFMNAFYAEMVNLSRTVLRGFALAMGKNENFFDDKITFENTMSTFRLNYYSFTENSIPIEIGSDGIQLGCETHKDSVLIKILYVPFVGGLQVENEDGNWIDVEPSSTNFVVNTGMCMTRWSNNVYNAANHRDKLLNTERISIPFFAEPAYDTLIESASPNDPNAEILYPPIIYGDYLAQSLRKFKEYSYFFLAQ